jgi:hypothetical protein
LSGPNVYFALEYIEKSTEKILEIERMSEAKDKTGYLQAHLRPTQPQAKIFRFG